MCKGIISSLLGGGNKATPQTPATPIVNSTGDTGVDVKNTSIGQGSGIDLGAGRDPSGRVRLSGSNTTKRTNAAVGITI